MSNKEIVIDFAANGTIEAMHMDGFDLGFLGDKKVTRATEIKFDEETQTWGLFLPSLLSGLWFPVAHGRGFVTYEQARTFEVAWLNICRVREVKPESETGDNILKAIRASAAYNDSKPPTIEQYLRWTVAQ